MHCGSEMSLCVPQEFFRPQPPALKGSSARIALLRHHILRYDPIDHTFYGIGLIVLVRQRQICGKKSMSLVTVPVDALSAFDQQPVCLSAKMSAYPSDPVFLLQPAAATRAHRVFIALY